MLTKKQKEWGWLDENKKAPKVQVEGMEIVIILLLLILIGVSVHR